jgi:hypothetical protein
MRASSTSLLVSRTVSSYPTRCRTSPVLTRLAAHVELPASLLIPPSAPNPSNSKSAAPSGSASVTPLINEKTKKHHLSTTTDPIFAELRDLNFSSIGKKLSRVAHRLNEDYNVCTASINQRYSFLNTRTKARHQAKTVAQLRDFVGKLGGLQTEHQALRLRKAVVPVL